MKHIGDIAKTQDNITVNGKEFISPSAKGIGKVEVMLSSSVDGKPIFTKNLYDNELLVTGTVFMSEKNSSMRSTFKTTPLDVELGTHTVDQIVTDNSTVPLEKIAGIMIGNGGCADVYNQVYPVNRSLRSVPGMIPFRVVSISDDLSATDRARYILRTVRGGYAYYYGKKFDVEREIHVEYEDGTTVPVDLDTVITDKFIQVYTLFRVTIDQRDVREYFKLTQGSTLRSLVNSVGLITGYPNIGTDGFEEYFNVRGFTAFNMENHELKNTENTISIIYKFYIQ